MFCRKNTNKQLFDPKMERFGEFRTATAYLRTAYTNDDKVSLTQLSYPLVLQVLISQQFTIVNDQPHQLNGVIDAQAITHVIHIFKSVDLSMLSYEFPTQLIPNKQKRNIIIIKDYTSVTEPQGIDCVFKVLNPDIVVDPAQPYFRKLYCKLQGRLDVSGSTRF